MKKLKYIVIPLGVLLSACNSVTSSVEIVNETNGFLPEENAKTIIIGKDLQANNGYTITCNEGIEWSEGQTSCSVSILNSSTNEMQDYGIVNGGSIDIQETFAKDNELKIWGSWKKITISKGEKENEKQ